MRAAVEEPRPELAHKAAAEAGRRGKVNIRFRGVRDMGFRISPDYLRR